MKLKEIESAYSKLIPPEKLLLKTDEEKEWFKQYEDAYHSFSNIESDSEKQNAWEKLNTLRNDNAYWSSAKNYIQDVNYVKEEKPFVESKYKIFGGLICLCIIFAFCLIAEIIKSLLSVSSFGAIPTFIYTAIMIAACFAAYNKYVSKH